MVDLGDLDIKVGLEDIGNGLQGANEHGDTQREVGAPENGSVSAQSGDALLLLGRVAGGAGEQGGAGAADICFHGVQGIRAGEVDDCVSHLVHLGKRGQILAAQGSHDLIAARQGGLFDQSTHLATADQ